MRLGLVVFDLDGTLLDAARDVHPANLRAIERLHQGGVRVSLATGRSPLSSRPHADKVRPTAPLVHFNGAMVRRFDDGAVLFRRALSTEVALAALSVAKAHGVHANVYVDDELWIDAPSDISRTNEVKDGLHHLVKGDVAALLAAGSVGPIKLMLIDTPARLASLEPLVRDAVAAVGAATLVRSEPEYLEVLPPGCDKLEATRHAAAAVDLDIGAVLAFGDNLNDLALLEGCGLGVAMGNAHDTVRARVATHIGPHTTDAIARFLDALPIDAGHLLWSR